MQCFYLVCINGFTDSEKSQGTPHYLVFSLKYLNRPFRTPIRFWNEDIIWVGFCAYGDLALQRPPLQLE